MSGSHDSTVRIWDLKRPAATPTLIRPANRCSALAVSDGRLVVAFGNDVAFFTRGRAS
ncbi:hypothetical protein ACIQZB_08395 [Streptomyces sp. NPDC097727]|uniref:hypothetical protein n=1 Tax=Streptomyces sp. NPDC097727 TaxID=3366092 RepID=UPI0037FAA201